MTDRKFGAESTTDEVLEGIDLSGKTVLITGGASGLGLETARAMMAKGAYVIIPVRDMAKGEEAAKTLREATGRDAVDLIELDLGSLESIRKGASAFSAKYDTLDLLINNAGVMACPFSKTADGFEMQFGTNHVGHFLLTNLLMPALLKADNARIVNLSSRGHHQDHVHFEDLHYENREYEKWPAYGQAKTANVLFTVGLEKRLADKGIHSYAVHPGGIATNLGRHLSEEDVAQLIARIQESSGGNFSMKSVEQGAATTCYAATAAELSETGGVYCEDCHVADVDDQDSAGSVRSYAIDPDKAEQLWEVSEEMVGETFTY